MRQRDPRSPIPGTARGLLVLIAAVGLSLLPEVGLAKGRKAALTFRTVATLELKDVADAFLSRHDFDGDGLTDLLVGGESPSPEDTRLWLLRSTGNGRFQDVSGGLKKVGFGAPRGVTGDFNGDRLVDVAVFDWGQEVDAGGTDFGKCYQGGPPKLLLGRRGGKGFKVSDALAKAVVSHEELHEPENGEPGPDLHVKNASVGDIDNDGDLDLFVESGGGFNQPGPHFMVNDGRGRFTLDNSDQRFSYAARFSDGGLTPVSRWNAGRLVDLDGDGWLDLVMGQRRADRRNHGELRSMILYNDGAGNFGHTGVTRFPLIPFKKGWTGVTSLAVGDIDGDRRPDVVLVHNPEDRRALGRYVQVMVNQGNREFVDQSRAWLGGQRDTKRQKRPDGSNNLNTIQGLELLDLDADGDLDLFMGLGYLNITPYSPLIHLNNGKGRFRPVDADAIAQGRSWVGAWTFPIDLNGDGVFDFVDAVRQAGPDGVYDTPDDRDALSSTLVDRR